MIPEVKTEMISNGPDLSILGLFFQADPFVKGVMFLLIFASIWCWTIIINKSNSIRKEKKLSMQFEDVFWSSHVLMSVFYLSLYHRPDNNASMNVSLLMQM